MGTVIGTSTVTGCPSIFAGENVQRIAAQSAASSSP